MQEKILVFLLLISILNIWEVNSIEERLKEDFNKIYNHLAITARDITKNNVTPDKIKYFLFTKKNPSKYTEIDPSNPEQLANKNVKIVFIIHGWTDSRGTQWYEDLKNAFLNKKQEYYVVQVDWSEPANQLYSISSYNTKDVGYIIGEFVVNLHKKYSIPLNNFLFVGHSLGGQVSGFIGKKVQELTNKKLPRIIALDPAGPLFISRPKAERLNKNDAEVVVVIHTDGGTFGFKESCGTIDFFPNGGSTQPGCVRLDSLSLKSATNIVACDHLRSYHYFIEALVNPRGFMARKCKSWLAFKVSNCEKEQVAMGDLETRNVGEFYLKTNKNPPFTKTEKAAAKLKSALISLKRLLI